MSSYAAKNEYVVTTSAKTVDRLNVNAVLGRPTSIFDKFWQRNDAAGPGKPRYRVQSLEVDDNGTLYVEYVTLSHHATTVTLEEFTANFHKVIFR